jgi:feruloyl esterase
MDLNPLVKPMRSTPPNVTRSVARNRHRAVICGCIVRVALFGVPAAASAQALTDWGGGYSKGGDSASTTIATSGAGPAVPDKLPDAGKSAAVDAPIRLGILNLRPSSKPVGRTMTALDCRDLASFAMSRTKATSASARFAQIPDAPTSIMQAEVVPAERDLPEVCRVAGIVAPDIHFELRMPTQVWNGKLMHYGCGGACGVVYRPQLEEPLARGYAVVSSDMGHSGAPNNWAFRYANLQAWLDFSYRATHVVTLAAKEVIDQYFGIAPVKSYFMGCSTGGVQGVIEAQRYPNDFQAILVGAPAYSTGPLFGDWNRRANLDANARGIMDPAKLPLVRKAVLAACDALDGTKDGLLQDPRRCHWDPAAMQCTDGQDHADCLTPVEVGVVRKLYLGPSTSQGVSLAYGQGGLSRGSEYEWIPWFVGAKGEHVDLEFTSSYGDGVYPLAAANAGKPYDYDKDPQRGDILGWARYGMNPDLRRFRDAGGKMIMWHGWDDAEVAPGASADYYDTTTRTMGGEEPTRQFFRLFMLPGVAHCRRGPGGDGIDLISYLEDWAERGEAPDAVLAHHLAVEQNYLGLPRPRYPLEPGTFDRTRPVYAYPDTATWSGKGTVTDAKTWKKAARATEPESKRN